MEHNSTVDKHPRRLVVTFCYPDFDLSHLTNSDCGDFPQLVYRQRYIKRSSRLVRFATRLGLANGDKQMLEAVEEAYTSITSNYAPGDQVVLAILTVAEWETDPHAKAAGMLAWYLCNGISPRNSSETRPGIVGHNRRIPIYAVIAEVVQDKKQSLSSWSDTWKLGLPLGVDHMICWSTHPFRSCSSRFDQDSTLILRELHFSSDDYHHELRRDITKHALYYKPDKLPKWEKHQPVWTHMLDSSSREARDILPSESITPAGMYHHELRSYQGLPREGGSVSMVVLKATRNGG